MSLGYRSLLAINRNIPPDLREGLIHAYTFDETSGTTLFDQIGSVNGTFVNNPTLGMSGKVNTSYNFDGINDYIWMNPIAYSFPYSMKIWVNIDSIISTTKVIIGTATTATTSNNYNGVALIQTNGAVHIQFGNGLGAGPSHRRTYTTPDVLTTGWNCIHLNVISFGVVDVYVNALLTSITYLSGSATTVSFTNVYTRLMRAANVTTVYSGDLDEFYIWNQLKTADQILQIYNYENAGISIL